jgi:hypothetical protein
MHIGPKSPNAKRYRRAAQRFLSNNRPQVDPNQGILPANVTFSGIGSRLACQSPHMQQISIHPRGVADAVVATTDARRCKREIYLGRR